MERKIQFSELRMFCENILVKVGVSQEDAFTIADSLVYANLRGIDSHGIIRFPFYLKRMVEGETKIQPNIQKIHETVAAVLLDGDSGMGQVTGTYAAKLAVTKAKEAGVAFAGVRGSGHFGAASYYAAKIAEANMIGIALSNGTPVMTAWGGAKRVISNNPLSIAAPYLEKQPIVFDISMSRVAGGKVRLAAKNKQTVPQGWIIDKHGRNTEDPNDLPDGGALLPFGEHKGWGLGFMVEILAGALTGAGMLGQIPLWFRDLQTPLNIGHCFMAVNIEAFLGREEFKQRLDWIVQEIKSSPVAEGFTEVLIPGEIEARVQEERTNTGIPISEEIWKDLTELSKKYSEPLAE